MLSPANRSHGGPCSPTVARSSPTRYSTALSRFCGRRRSVLGPGPCHGSPRGAQPSRLRFRSAPRAASPRDRVHWGAGCCGSRLPGWPLLGGAAYRPQAADDAGLNTASSQVTGHLSHLTHRTPRDKSRIRVRTLRRTIAVVSLVKERRSSFHPGMSPNAVPTGWERWSSHHVAEG